MLIWWIAAGACLVSYGFTGRILSRLLSRRIVDLPNARSSHSAPTPRGGGLSMVITITAGAAVLRIAGLVPSALAIVLLVGGLAIAAVGFWDDIRGAPILVRMGVHFGAAALAVYELDVLHGIRLGAATADLGVLGVALGMLAVVWIVNLFNFMDGIDGIAASEAAFMLLSSALIGTLVSGASLAAVAPALLAGGACLGFLKWNWPPAAIFMGDVGSGYLGFVIAAIAVSSSQAGIVSFYAWLILGGVFLVDATLTLSRRLLRGEAVYHAHRSHAYQWLARRWGSHRKVTAAVLLVDVFWLLPLAAVAVRFEPAAPWICAGALAPLILCASLTGSGRAEPDPTAEDAPVPGGR
jgi:Fuc2NAc and GlcNAc transferase